MAKVLTAAAVARLRAGKVRREIPDGGSPGLRLVIQPGSGAKSWAMRFRRPGGKAAKLTLGPVNLSGKEPEGEPVIGQPLTLASARRLAVEVQRQRAMGKDVVAVRHRELLEREARGENTFSAAAHDYVEQHAKRKVRRWREQASLLGLDHHNDELTPIAKGLADRWRDRPIGEIDGDDVHALIEEVREQGVPGQARSFAKGPSEARGHAMFSVLSKMFSWLGERRRVRNNPCIGVARPKLSAARDRVLSADEIVAFWQTASAEHDKITAVLKLLLLTGCRLREVAEMHRAELSDDGATWTIPSARTKNKRVHVLSLPPLAQDILSAVASDHDLVFTDANGKFISWSRVKRRLDAVMNIPPWRLHDLRRTAATGMAEIGIMPHVVEAALNHVSGAKASVAGVYNRAAYAPEKKAALERWAAHVEALIAGKPATNVVTLQAAVR
jgi:integrase